MPESTDQVLPVETRRCHIALFDILGFRHLIQSTGNEPVDLLGRFVRQSQALTGISGPRCKARLAHRIFQDTLVAYTLTPSPEDLRCLIEYACATIAFAFVDGINLRGAITTGDVILSDLATIGKAFVRAYEMEQAQDWIGGWVDDACFESDPVELKSAYLIVRHPIPLKSGPVRAGWALNWPLCITCSDGGVRLLAQAWMKLVPQGDSTWEVRRKLINLNNFLTVAAARNWRPTGVVKCSHGESIHIGPGWLADHQLWSATVPDIGDEASAKETPAPGKRPKRPTKRRTT